MAAKMSRRQIFLPSGTRIYAEPQVVIVSDIHAFVMHHIRVEYSIRFCGISDLLGNCR